MVRAVKNTIEDRVSSNLNVLVYHLSILEVTIFTGCSIPCIIQFYLMLNSTCTISYFCDCYAPSTISIEVCLIVLTFCTIICDNFEMQRRSSFRTRRTSVLSEAIFKVTFHYKRVVIVTIVRCMTVNQHVFSAVPHIRIVSQ